MMKLRFRFNYCSTRNSSFVRLGCGMLSFENMLAILFHISLASSDDLADYFFFSNFFWCEGKVMPFL